ncbi:MAG: hypothetical protein ACO3LE_05740 [Bdellovibrionota bacterium]
MRLKMVIFFLGLGGLLSCGPGSPKVEVPLIFDPDGEAIRILGFGGVDALAPLYTRVIWTHRLQKVNGSPGFKIYPIEAAPPTQLTGQPAFLKTDWNLARGAGVPWNPDRPTLEVSGLPLNVQELKFAIEFLYPVIEIEDGEDVRKYYVVAYACVDFNLNEVVDLSTLKSRLAEGVNVYSGRTCGQCPRLEGPEEDDPAFNYDDLNSDPVNIPNEECPQL